MEKLKVLEIWRNIHILLKLPTCKDYKKDERINSMKDKNIKSFVLTKKDKTITTYNWNYKFCIIKTIHFNKIQVQLFISCFISSKISL